MRQHYFFPVVRGWHRLLCLLFISASLGGCASVASVSDRELHSLVQSQAALIHTQAQRLQRVEDIQAIERLERAYGYYVDKHLWDQVVALFAEKSSVEFAQRGVYQDKKGVRRMFLEQMGGGKVGLKHGTLFNHIQVQEVVDVAPDGKSAKGRFRAIIQVAGFASSEGFWADGIYENEFVKEQDIWKFSKMRFWPTYYTPYKEGWSGAQMGCINGDGSGKTATADAPATLGGGVYPNVFYPPFHYPNPVTGKEVDLNELNQRALAETIWPKCPPPTVPAVAR